MTGLLVPPDDGDALAAAVAELAGDADRRRAYGLAARRRGQSPQLGGGRRRADRPLPRGDAPCAATGRPAGRLVTGAAGGLRIVRLANFVTPAPAACAPRCATSARATGAAGHEPVLVVPGQRRTPTRRTGGPGDHPARAAAAAARGGYRLLAGRRRLARLLDRPGTGPVEVSDRTTLRWTGRWARAHGVPSVMVSHESLTGLLGSWGVPDALRRPLADRLNRRDRPSVRPDRLHDRLGRRRVRPASARQRGSRCRSASTCDTFHPDRRRPAVREPVRPTPTRCCWCYCSRLSAGEAPELAVDPSPTLRAGRRTGACWWWPATARCAAALADRAAGLPVHVRRLHRRPAAVAALLASADVVLAPGPVETFGLAAPGGAGLRHPGGGQRGQRAARGGRRGRAGGPGTRRPSRRAYAADGRPERRTPRGGPGPGRAFGWPAGRRRLPAGHGARPAAPAGRRPVPASVVRRPRTLARRHPGRTARIAAYRIGCGHGAT